MSDRTITVHNRSYSIREIIDRVDSGKLEILGEGNFGRVYLYDNNIVVKALKECDPSTLNGKFVQQELDTALVLNRTCVQGVAEVYEVVRDKSKTGKCYIFMEYIYGYNLYEYIDERYYYDGRITVTDDDYIKLFRHLLRILQCIHRAGVTHRDIKPENILMNCRDYTVRIIDFGLSCVVNTMSDNKSLCYEDPGDLHYVSPERMDVANSKPRVDRQETFYPGDVWAMGMTFLFVYRTDVSSGKYFVRKSYDKLVKYIRTHPVNKFLDGLILGMIEWNYKKRMTVDDALRYIDKYRKRD